jgi:sugar phosphate isomerase/epimerase
MNIAVMAYSYAGWIEGGKTSLPRMIGHLREIGVGSVELMHSLVREEELPALRDVLSQSPPIGVACYDLRVEAIVAALSSAASLGAKRVMVTPVLDAKDIGSSMARKQFAEALRRALPLARELGITLTIENLGILADTYGRSDQIESICREVGPELRVTFDAGNFLLAGEDAVTAFERLAPRVVHVHFKDWKVVPASAPASIAGIDGRHYQGAALGEGIVDLRGTLRRLRGIGYDGAISVEYEGPDDPHKAVRRGVEFLREEGVC